MSYKMFFTFSVPTSLLSVINMALRGQTGGRQLHLWWPKLAAARFLDQA